jgi:hypothetical protein
MGIWSVEGFASDDALDWIESLDPHEGPEPVLRVLRTIAEAPDPRLTAARAEIGLAAAELVAAMNGQAHPDLPAAARRWIESQTGDSVVPLESLIDATRALDFVVTSSQLAEAWSQRVDRAAWRATLDDLRMRLAAAGGVPPANGAAS